MDRVATLRLWQNRDRFNMSVSIYDTNGYLIGQQEFDEDEAIDCIRYLHDQTNSGPIIKIPTVLGGE